MSSVFFPIQVIELPKQEETTSATGSLVLAEKKEKVPVSYPPEQRNEIEKILKVYFGTVKGEFFDGDIVFIEQSVFPSPSEVQAVSRLLKVAARPKDAVLVPFLEKGKHVNAEEYTTLVPFCFRSFDPDCITELQVKGWDNLKTVESMFDILQPKNPEIKDREDIDPFLTQNVGKSGFLERDFYEEFALSLMPEPERKRSLFEIEETIEKMRRERNRLWEDLYEKIYFVLLIKGIKANERISLEGMKESHIKTLIKQIFEKTRNLLLSEDVSENLADIWNSAVSTWNRINDLTEICVYAESRRGDSLQSALNDFSKDNTSKKCFVIARSSVLHSFITLDNLGKINAVYLKIKEMPTSRL